MLDANACDIEIFGRFAGRLVADGGRFVFRAAIKRSGSWTDVPSTDPLKPRRRFIEPLQGVRIGEHLTFRVRAWEIECHLAPPEP